MSQPFVPIETAKIVWQEELPYSLDFNDIYFSKDNGLAEAKHVFIEGNQLLSRWQNLSQDSFIIGETGFGTGLNFLLSCSLWLEQAPKSAKLHFISCEKHPLSKNDLRRCLNLWPELALQARALIDSYPILTPGFHSLSFEDGRIQLTLILGEAIECFKQLLVCGNVKLEKELRINTIDAWFLDGFSPAKNPGIWSFDLFQILALLSKPGSSLATFSVAKLVKKNLEKAGFQLQKQKGFGRKRNMLVGQFRKSEVCTRKLYKTPWQFSKAISPSHKKATVLGAGLAGCYTAYSLAKRGWQITLIDENKEVAQGASGNQQAVLYPKLSAFCSPFSEFMLSAYLFAVPLYRKFLQQGVIGELSGILQFAVNDKEHKVHQDLKKWLLVYPKLAKLVDASEASYLGGIPLDCSALFIPDAGWINSQNLCEFLAKSSGINLINEKIVKLSYEEDRWQLNSHEAEILIIANGFQASQFEQTSHLPLKTIRGQMSSIAVNQESSRLKIPLCSEGHILPQYQGQHAIGASYHLQSMDKHSHKADDLENMKKLTELPTKITWPKEILNHWTGIRASTPDYLPLVGPVANAQVFSKQFVSLATNSKRWLAYPGAYLPGLFVCAGFGSRGLATIPLCAEWLASVINQEPSVIPQSMVQSLSPARFLLRAIIKNQSE